MEKIKNIMTGFDKVVQILSFLRSPTYQLSKHLATLLYPLIGNSSSHVRNSKAFTDFIRTQVLMSDELLVSFDVVSLFTNVPIHLATEVAQHRLRDDADLKDHTGLSVSQLPFLLWRYLPTDFDCSGVPSLRNHCPPSHGRRGRESCGNHGHPPEVLKALR